MIARRFEFDRQVLAAVWRGKVVFGLHVGANLALFALVWLWLSIPESRVWHLVLSLALALSMALGVLWLQAATLHLFRQAHEDAPTSLAGSFRATRGRLPAVLVWALGVWLFIGTGAGIVGLLPALSARIATALTWVFRVPVSLSIPVLALGIVAGFLLGIVVPLVLLLVGSGVSEHGWAALRMRGLGGAIGVARRPGLWLRFAACLCVGAYLPCLLIDWVPDYRAMWAQAASMSVRFLVAYLLAVAAWLALASLVGRADGAGLAADRSATGRPFDAPPVP